MSDAPETVPREKYVTEPTPRGHRLDVARWSHTLILSVLTDVMNLPPGEAFAVSACQLGVMTGATRSEAERLVEHTLSFFNDPDLVALGLDALRKVHAALKPPASPPPSIPPARGMN